MPITQIGYLDNGDITGYWLSESSTPPTAGASGWLSYQPTRFTFAATGTDTVYLFIKDAGGNVSLAASATVTVSAQAGYRNDLGNDLPSTGQTLSYSAGDDGDLTRGVKWPLPRFVNQTLDQAEDGLTGLVWPRNFNLIPAVNAGFDNDGTANDGMVTWQHALDFVSSLNTANYLGHNDWRLPTVTELRSLQDLSRTSPALPYAHPFLNVANNNYWSSTSYEGDHTQAWYADLNTGNVNVTAKSGNYYLVPVRGGVTNFAGADLLIPRILGFSLVPAWEWLTVPITELTSVDNVGVTGWYLSENATVPSSAASGWLTAQPKQFTFATSGNKTLHAWVKDAAGNVSVAADATVVITPFSTVLPVQNVMQQTGQSACYDTGGTLLSACDGSGQDGMERIGTALPTIRFTKGVATMSDNLTGLVWAKDGNLVKDANPSFDTDGTAGDGYVTWQHALDFIATLNQQNYRTFNDWRLPTVAELRTLADYSAGGSLNQALINAGFSTALANTWYWSSTSYMPAPKNAWVFSATNGAVSYSDKTTTMYPLLAVRGAGTGSQVHADTDQVSCTDSTGAIINCAGTGQDGAYQVGAQPPSPRFDTTRYFTFTDLFSGLVWSRDGNPVKNQNPSFDADGTAGDGAVTWQHALDFVRSANQNAYLGYSDWRLPNLNELQSAVSMEGTTISNWLNGRAFLYTEPSRYWSSTSYDGSNAWYQDLASGQTGTEAKSAQHLLLMVRSGVGASVASVTVYKTGSGAGTVTGDSGKISCGGDCFESYPTLGGSVTLTATAEAGSTFTGWSGACSGTGNCTLSLFGDLFVTASFSRPAATIAVMDSGQSSCYDLGNNPVACSAAGALHGDGAFLSGPQLPFDRFHDNGNGTVTDLLSGLIIPKDLNLLKSRDPLFDADGTAGDGAVTWLHALDYIEKLNREQYLGFGDWRLPNLREMQEFADYSAKSALYTWNSMGLLFNNQESWYWTSTTQEASRNNAWLFALNSGATTTTGKTSSYYLLPVRGGNGSGLARTVRTGQNTCSDSGGTLIPCSGTGQDADTLRGEVWPTPRFGSDGIVITDQATGLVWSSDANPILSFYNDPVTYYDTDGARDGAVSWQKAMQFIDRINADTYLGYSDWRLPSVTELASLVHYGAQDQKVWLSNYSNWFINLNYAGYWSSTTLSTDATQGWFLNLANGATSAQAKTTQSYVLAVRAGNGAGSASLTTVKSGAGSGIVTSQQGGGIACGTTCFAAYPAAGSSVTLTATPDAGSAFLGWSGGGCSGTAGCTVTVNGALEVTALFGASGSILPSTATP